MKKLELPLCTPCREELRREGRAIDLVSHRTDGKVRCAICNRTRYGGVYHVSAAYGSKGGEKNGEL